MLLLISNNYCQVYFIYSLLTITNCFIQISQYLTPDKAISCCISSDDTKEEQLCNGKLDNIKIKLYVRSYEKKLFIC